MINLTTKEKAARYDALQSALHHLRDSYSRRRVDATLRYKDATMIGVYNKGLSDGFGYILDDLERLCD